MLLSGPDFDSRQLVLDLDLPAGEDGLGAALLARRPVAVGTTWEQLYVGNWPIGFW